MSREKSLQELDEEAEELSRQWETSREKECLVEQVKGVLLSQKSICIDNALCLGLGSIQVATPKLVLPEGFELASSEDQDLLQLEEDRETSPPVPKWQDQNKSLYQLLVFETALSYLREKFTITSVRFQDPQFTEVDKAFLSKRGHTVLDWNPKIPLVKMSYIMDPRLADIISSSTMCYCPYLDVSTIVEVIVTAKPSLYLGRELISNTANMVLYNFQRWRAFMKTYTDIALTYDFSRVIAFGEDPTEQFGFMWPADMADKEVEARVQEWNSTMIEMERENWKYWMDKRAAEGET